jgi:hypothetical protein
VSLWKVEQFCVKNSKFSILHLPITNLVAIWVEVCRACMLLLLEWTDLSIKFWFLRPFNGRSFLIFTRANKSRAWQLHQDCTQIKLSKMNLSTVGTGSSPSSWHIEVHNLEKLGLKPCSILSIVWNLNFGGWAFFSLVQTTKSSYLFQIRAGVIMVPPPLFEMTLLFLGYLWCDSSVSPSFFKVLVHDKFQEKSSVYMTMWISYMILVVLGVFHRRRSLNPFRCI